MTHFDLEKHTCLLSQAALWSLFVQVCDAVNDAARLPRGRSVEYYYASENQALPCACTGPQFIRRSAGKTDDRNLEHLGPYETMHAAARAVVNMEFHRWTKFWYVRGDDEPAQCRCNDCAERCAAFHLHAAG